MPRTNSILFFSDKLGISQGYQNLWHSLLNSVGLMDYTFIERNSFRSLGNTVQLLTRIGNRKAPGFNPDPTAQQAIRSWALTQIQVINPLAIACWDPALLFLVNPNWEQATIDLLRGGVYRVLERPFLVMLPVSAWHTQKKQKDIIAMNDGYADQEEWEEAHGGVELDSELNNMWIEPLVVPYGRFVLKADLLKLNRVIGRERQGITS